MKENGKPNEKYLCIFHMMLNCKIEIRVIMFQFVIFLLLSVVLAKNYAIIYASIEPIRDSTLPTSACHIISVLISALYYSHRFLYGYAWPRESVLPISHIISLVCNRHAKVHEESEYVSHLSGLLHRFKRLIIFAEAVYADAVFAYAKNLKNVLVLTIKDYQLSGNFIHIYEYSATSKYVKNVWDNTWISLLPLACNKSVKYLMSMAIAASLQQVDQLASPVMFGDPMLVNQELSSLLELSWWLLVCLTNRLPEGVRIGVWIGTFEERPSDCEQSDGEQLQSDDSAAVLSPTVQRLFE